MEAVSRQLLIQGYALSINELERASYKLQLCMLKSILASTLFLVVCLLFIDFLTLVGVALSFC